MIGPSPELGVIHVSTSQPQCIQCPTRKAVTSPINSFPHSGHLSPIIQSPMFFIMQKITMRTDRHIVDVDFIVTFFNCAFHSITTDPLSFPTHPRCAAVSKSIPAMQGCLRRSSEPPSSNRAILFLRRCSHYFEIYSFAFARIRLAPLDALDAMDSHHQTLFQAAYLSDL